MRPSAFNIRYVLLMILLTSLLLTGFIFVIYHNIAAQAATKPIQQHASIQSQDDIQIVPSDSESE